MNVIVYHNSKEHEVNLEFFFQHELIKDLKSFEVYNVYESTRVYEDILMHDVINQIKLKKVTKAREILAIMVKDKLGKYLGQNFMDELDQILIDERRGNA